MPIDFIVLCFNNGESLSLYRLGVTLEHGPRRLMNNSIVILNDIGEDSEALFCATDSRTCCSAESEDDGNWYSPNGSKIGPQTINSSQALYISWNNHTIGLNYVNISDIASGIYHCELADNNNITNHLYVGIYPQEEGRHSIQHGLLTRNIKP